MAENEEEIKVNKETGAGSGIKVTKIEGELEPPLTEEKQRMEEEQVEEEVSAKRVMGKVPISPAVIKPPLRFEGLALAEITGYPGWIYSEEDLEDIATLIADCGWSADPRIQVLFALVGLHGAKFTAYMAWKRTGRKGDLRKRDEEGELEKTKRPGEDVIA